MPKCAPAAVAGGEISKRPKLKSCVCVRRAGSLVRSLVRRLSLVDWPARGAPQRSKTRLHGARILHAIAHCCAANKNINKPSPVGCFLFNVGHMHIFGGCPLSWLLGFISHLPKKYSTVLMYLNGFIQINHHHRFNWSTLKTSRQSYSQQPKLLDYSHDIVKEPLFIDLIPRHTTLTTLIIFPLIRWFAFAK